MSKMPTALFVLTLLAVHPAIPAQSHLESRTRDAFQEYVDTLTAGSGIWTASNEAYRSDSEPYDAYRLTWRKGVGGRSAYGRLSGLNGIEESEAISEIRLYWHAGEKQARVMQFSRSGMFSDGRIDLLINEGLDDLASVQTFYPPDGDPFQLRQVIDFDDDEQHVESFKDIGEGWHPSRTYDWHLEIEPASLNLRGGKH